MQENEFENFVRKIGDHFVQTSSCFLKQTKHT